MSQTVQNDYWVAPPNKRRLLRRFDRYMKWPIKSILVERYGVDEATTIIDDGRAELERLIPHIPFIGEDNPMTRYLLQAASSLALHRALQRRGATVDDTGEIISMSTRAMLLRIPGFLRRLTGKLYFGDRRIRRQQESAVRSQVRRYPGDWVWEVIPGDGETFDFGIDITECGILKFMQAQGAEDLMPYMCHMDYVTLGAIGVELKRTKTLAYGCDRCDFRMIKGGIPPQDWPPAFPERDCGAVTNA
jgi:hypothetical protein